MQDPARKLEQLLRLVRFRAHEESRLSQELSARLAEAERRYQAASQDLQTRVRGELEESEREYQGLLQEIGDEFSAQSAQVQAEFEAATVEASRDCTHTVSDAEHAFDDARWMVDSVYDRSAEDSPAYRYELFRNRAKKEREFLEVQGQELDNISQSAVGLLRQWRQGTDIEVTVPDVGSQARDELHEQHVRATDEAGQHLAALKRKWLARQFSGVRPLVLLLVLLAAAFPAIYVVRGDLRALVDNPGGGDARWLGTSAALAVASSLGFAAILYGIARARIMRHFRPLQAAVVYAASLRRAWQTATKREAETLRSGAEEWSEQQKAHRRKAMTSASQRKKQSIREAESRRDALMQAASRQRDSRLKAIVDRRDRRLREANEKYPALSSSLDNRLDAQQQLMSRRYEDETADITGQMGAEWDAMATAWHEGYSDFAQCAEQLQREVRERFPEWSELATVWEPPQAAPDRIPIGHFDLRLDDLDGGPPIDPRLGVQPTEFRWPALLAFPQEASLLIRTAPSERQAAVDLLRTTMLRLLTSLPPGKARFTIIDPVGLGESFSAFMHLADYDEVLVNSRIWTEEQQINKKLLDLTEHMENVFQTYLRNEFATIQDYNRQAGEVAEPYHFLVIADFPGSFSDEAARRLTSIVSSGPRCGVHTLMSYDPRQDMPRDFRIEDLVPHATSLQHVGGRFVWQHELYGQLPLTIEPPPGPAEFSTIVRNVGEQSRDARHVEVSFDRVAPEPARIWSLDSRKGIDVPLGRAGATKLQHLRLGRGTSQHVMIAGKTGSGKSTLLHILITNTALHYSADEVEFYLIDFKKGVEFKTYAANRLPHARVVAIESDREFGLSVLQRLDGVLRERGDLFRDVGVQDIASYRDAHPDTVMPRIMLVIDEFQEFFVDDDQIGQKAGLLLDRLVRQGRAFGIHVLLGSQTLGGAYSLARSTMGQIAVRIALQCSDADSHLILSEENMAARLLARPGEAIYNDANGMLEGNHPFQIAWLDDERREHYLLSLVSRDAAAERRPVVVFEGNVPADPTRNVALHNTILSRQHQAAPHSVRLWLGEPVAIRESTSVPLRRQSGHNLLIVGQNATLARGTLLMATISAAVQIDPAVDRSASQLATFYVLTPDDHDKNDSIWQNVADSLPHEVRIVNLRDTAETVRKIREEIARRDAENLTDQPPVYVIINGLSRFRDLRKDEDDYGFGGFDSGDKPVSCSKQFAEIVREGPSLGVQTIAWCDTYSNTTRWLSTQSIREFELRVCFQMNATDSANLVDAPTASRLGPNRAVLYVEEVGAAEKFRPYGTPDPDWLADIGRQLSGESPAVAESDAPAPEVASAEPELVDELDGWTIE